MIKDQNVIRILTKLVEEMGEAAQQVGKYIEWGPDSFHPENPSETNTILLSKEIGDIYAVVDLMNDLLDLPALRTQRAEKNYKLGRMGYGIRDKPIRTKAQ